MIKEFRGEYFFLSNFYPCEVEYEGIVYPSSEHAYMAAKSTEPAARDFILNCGHASNAKKYGRNLVLRDGWEGMKKQVMYDVLLSKFTRNTELRSRLLATGDQELVEGNWWNDKFWGVCLKTNQGKNHLGKTLMRIRQEIGPKISIVNKHHGATGEYIGRGSPLGNPYSHMEGTSAQFKVANRNEAVAKYRDWLKEKIDNNDESVCDALNNIVVKAMSTEGVNLQCFCAPKACHGDVIKEVIEQAIRHK